MLFCGQTLRRQPKPGKGRLDQDVSLPLYQGAEELIRLNLEALRDGNRAPIVPIGFLTDVQFEEINRSRKLLDLHLLEQNEILFIGRHLFNSRSSDGYTIDDMVDQIASSLSSISVVNITHQWSRIECPTARPDRYGNMVFDRGVFEMTARKPRAELFSVIPKGDLKKPGKF